jgi:DNA-binding protein HU-beta
MVSSAIVKVTPGKNDLIDYAASKVEGASKDVVKAIVDKTIEAFQLFLENQGILRILDLGTFTMRKTAARKGRNPKTGEAIDIPALKKVSFKMSGAWRNDINKAVKSRAAQKAAEAKAVKKPKPAKSQEPAA